MSDRPIVYTITQQDNNPVCTIYTTDSRIALNLRITEVHFRDLFLIMEQLARELNNEGYAVLFEVD